MSVKWAAIPGIMFALSTMQAGATEILTNGGFETGDFTGWTVVNVGNGGCGTNAWTVNSAGSHGCSGFVGNMPAPISGSFAAYNTFDGPISALQISQQVTLPGSISSATLSFIDTVRMSIGGAARTFTVDLFDATNTTLLGNLFSESFQNVNQGWLSTSTDVTANLLSNAGQTVTLRVSNIMPESFTGPAGFGIDNISLDVTSSVPNPATVGLLGLGLAGIGYQRRKLNKAS